MGADIAGAASPQEEAGHNWFRFFVFHVLSMLLMIGVLATAADPSSQVALVYSPGITATDALTRAAGTGAGIVRLGRFDWIVVVAPEANDSEFFARARASGVLAFLSPWIAGACAPRTPSIAPINQQGST